MTKTLNVSIIGVTGYTGLELLRLLEAHPHVAIKHLVSRSNDGEKLSTLYPHMLGSDYVLSSPDLDTVAKDSDFVFTCLPHKASQETVANLYGKTKVIDLSADFRLDDPVTYEKYYHTPHNHHGILDKAVYGAPEFHRDAIKKADLVANPGCFALLGQLLTYPFKDTIESVDIFAVTGSSGLGKEPKEGGHHPIRAHNVKSYNINRHRHIAEIIRTAGIKEEQLNFVPTSGPFVRGIFAQAFIHFEPGANFDFDAIYKDEPFIRKPDAVQLAHIVGSNYADLHFEMGHNHTIIAQGALDNLVKGASGCAIQNMNLMAGLDETAGLKHMSPLYP